MPLPATYDAAVIAQAVPFARAHLEQFYSVRENPWSSDPLVSPGTGHAFFRHLLSHNANVLMQTVELRMMIIALAKIGWAEAADVLRHVALEMRSRRQELPVELENYEMEVRARGNDRWSKPPGPNRLDNLARDLVVAQVVSAVCDRFKVLPTQQSGRTISACAIVATAMSGHENRRHGRVSYKAVEKIWRRYGNAMPTVPGWTFRGIYPN
jgi:hypothetical protein